MSLIRCTQLLSRKNQGFLNVFKHSSVCYSDDKKSSDDGAPSEVKEDSDKKVEKSEKKQSGSFTPESQNRLNELLKKLSSRSTLKIVKEVQISLEMKPVSRNQALNSRTKTFNWMDYYHSGVRRAVEPNCPSSVNG